MSVSPGYFHRKANLTQVCLCQQTKQMTFWEIEVGLCARLGVQCAPTLLPFPLSFKTLHRCSKASRLLVLYPWSEASI